VLHLGALNASIALPPGKEPIGWEVNWAPEHIEICRLLLGLETCRLTRNESLTVVVKGKVVPVLHLSTI
jgi:hypothetical protein